MKTFETFIHFDDCDPAKIVFFGNYYKLAHRAMEQYFQTSKIGWEGWFRHAELGFPLVHSEADYHSPLRGGQSIWIEVGVEKLGTTSVTFKYRFLAGNNPSSEVLAEVRTVHVCIDFNQKKKVPIPENLREILREI